MVGAEELGRAGLSRSWGYCGEHTPHQATAPQLAGAVKAS